MDTKEHIMNVSLDLFAKNGYEGVSIRDIVREANVNLGAITYHFGGKEELYREMVLSAIKTVRGKIEKIETMEYTSIEKLEKFIRIFMGFILEHPKHARLFLMEMGSGDQRFLEIMEPYGRANFGTIRTILSEGIQKGEFRDMNVHLTGISIFGMCTQFISVKPMILRMMGKEDYEPEFIQTVIEHTVKFVLQAVKN